MNTNTFQRLVLFLGGLFYKTPQMSEKIQKIKKKTKVKSVKKVLEWWEIEIL